MEKKIIIYPESKKQGDKLKAFLEKSKMYFEIEEPPPPYDFKRISEIQTRRNRDLHSLITKHTSELKKIFDEHDMKINPNRKA